MEYLSCLSRTQVREYSMQKCHSKNMLVCSRAVEMTALYSINFFQHLNEYTA